MKRILLAAFAIALATPAQAADPRYPDWPCAQAKVPELSVAAMWAGPSLDEAAKAWESDAKTKDLVPRLAARRTPLEEAQKSAAEFITGSAAEREQKAKLLFAGLFDRLNRERTEVMNGIERVARHQKDMADKIKSDVAALHNAQDAAPADQAKIEQLAAQVEWSTRIFEDRRKTIRFVCEVPVQIEQRLFALARTAQQAME
jgi:DNA polymerase III alpha subunit